MLEGVSGIASVLLLAAFVAAGPADQTVQGQSCMEDQPCWTWSRMGDRTRGVLDRQGHRVTVEACEFSYRKAHHLLSPKTKPLKGDATAQKMCPPKNTLAAAIDADGQNDRS
jgi:hypothetical protein